MKKIIIIFIAIITLTMGLIIVKKTTKQPEISPINFDSNVHSYKTDFLIPEYELPEYQNTLIPIQEEEEEEYPIARNIWNYMKEQNWSDEVCAGIMGNIMAESGGHTLDIQWDIYNSQGFYGICQWSPKWYPEVIGVSLIEQLDHLAYNISNEFRIFGKNYYNNFTLNDFLFLESPEEAAKAFAKVYERCNDNSIEKRKENALIAYEYFTTSDR